MSGLPSPGRVFISYAHDDDGHVGKVRDLYRLLRSAGVDADLDLPAGERRQDWALWMLRGIRDSRRVIVVASPAYKRRAEGDALPGEGAGVQWEALLLRNLVYADPTAALDRIVPVVLPGGSPADLPLWLGGSTTAHCTVREFSADGAEKLLRLLTGQPFETVPELGRVPRLPTRDETVAAASAPAVDTLSPPVPATTPVPAPQSLPLPPSQPPPAAFVLPEQQDLLDALLACPALHQLAARHELLLLMGELLGLDHPFDVPESPHTRTHLRALCRRVERTTLTADAALKAMCLALEEIAPDDIGTKRVRDLLVSCGLVLGEE
ncbi:toll/interleukin-1 receptor domain-containing protein [Streptomyces sp. NPDC096152]|uniref:toll/interleukin-1 receptor domain-containing protein n=1 Tax=Streptomyces sp. NPDC096152 TaxID=3366078 RepID=UPI00381A6655